MMEVKEFLECMNNGKKMNAGSEIHECMHWLSQINRKAGRRNVQPIPPFFTRTAGRISRLEKVCFSILAVFMLSACRNQADIVEIEETGDAQAQMHEMMIEVGGQSFQAMLYKG